MNIFITGGNGLIGSHVIKQLLRKKNKIICFDKKNSNKFLKQKNFTFIKGDILDYNSVVNAVKKMKIDILLHFAAYLGVKKTERFGLECLKINISGTENILKAAIQYDVKRFIFASSSEVYGNGNNKLIKEDTDLKPKSSYGISKLAGESFIKSYQKKYGLKYNILRFFNVYGKNQREDFVIPKFAKNIKTSKPIKIYGNGNQIRSFCHVRDAALAVEKVLKKGKKNEVYNIGNDKEPISILNLAKLMAKESKKKIKIKKIPFSKSDRSINREIFKRQPNIDKIKSHTGYKPQTNLRTGVKDIIHFNSYDKDL